MAILKCKMCGGDLVPAAGSNVCECEYCGSKQTVPNADDEKRVGLFNRANRLRISSEFDKAAGLYEQIIQEYPEEAEAYWGLCLCNYGIEYVDDPVSGKKIPTCHRASFDKMRKDVNYELALENADDTARMIYEEQAKEIDRIMGDVLSVSRSEEPYDIFICYKETDNTGSRTPDSVLAQDIYDALTARQYRVFFARITLEDKLGTQYEPYIFAALNSAKVMLVVGTDYAYMNAVWVKNEWSRFLKLMAADKSKILIPCYKDMDPYDMPNEFQGLQSQDCGKLGFMQDLTRGIDKLTGHTEKATAPAAVKETVIVQSEGGANVTALLKRGNDALEDEEWDSAKEFFNRVLDMNAECAEAYLGLFLGEKHCSSLVSLNEKEEYENSKYWARAKKYAASETLSEIEKYEENHQRYLKKKEVEQQERLQREEEEKRRERERAAEQLAEAEDLFAQLMSLQDDEKRESKADLLASLKQEKEREINDIRLRIKKLEEEIVNFPQNKEKLLVLRARVADLENQRINQEKTVEALQKELSSLGVFAGVKKKELKEQVATQIAEFESLKQKLENGNSEIKGLETKLNELVSLESIQKSIEALASEIPKKEAIFDEKIKSLEITQNNKTTKLSVDEIIAKINSTPYVKAFIERKTLELPEKINKQLGFRNIFGNYPQGANGEILPIEWLPLRKVGSKLLLISKYALDCMKYNNTYDDVTWENSSLRQWLNNTFLNQAFSKEHQMKILETKIEAHKNPGYATDPGKDTIDKVFLLSINEVEEYFASRKERKCVPTDYAMVQGASVSNGITVDGKPTCWWWLRSSGRAWSHAATVYDDGLVYYYGSNVCSSDNCVRPAMWINLDP